GKPRWTAGSNTYKERFKTKLDCLATKIHILFQKSYFSGFYLFRRIFLPAESPLPPLYFKFVSDLRPNFASRFPGLCIFFVLLSDMQPKEN
ncbi:hypothetical protein, partial [Alistipes shahii]|uniref:hypothetical protein n=3 Tax=Alistipes shahii TaxID=328814 RepID=UPI003AAAD007